ncbi:MAG: hypothetical protein J0I41_24385, partial [Filimonas sp.]|nr:hypothetical protein [Filimonas sp.]
VLTLGDYWGKNINIPGIITPVGNDFFYRKPITENDNSILIISTIIHGGELRSLTRDLALLCPNLKIKYKLHPNEFHLVDEYLLFFVEIQNVKVICDEIDTNILIAKSRLVILIVSAVLYEALNQSKKVVIYKKLNYERQLTLAKLPNVYLIDLASEVYDIIEKPIIPNHVNFYKATDSVQIKKLVSI